MSKRTLFIVFIILIAAAFRFLPHPPNVAPIAAMALFGGAFFNNRWMAFLVPMGAMLLSDAAFQFFVAGTSGFHATMPFVYASFLLIVLLGRGLKDKMSGFTVLGGSLAGSVLFFLISNFGVWLTSPMYPLTINGLVQCYTLAIPFFHYTLAGDLFYNGVLFGSAWLAFKNLPAFART